MKALDGNKVEFGIQLIKYILLRHLFEIFPAHYLHSERPSLLYLAPRRFTSNQIVQLFRDSRTDFPAI